MRLRLVAAVAGIMSLAFPAVASAGRVTHDASRITFQADPSAGESVDVGVENGMAFVDSSQDITSSDCGAQTDPKRVECPLTPAFVVNLLDSDDRVSGRLVTGSATLEAHGGAGGDSLTGTPNADLLDGGPGDDTFIDGAGADTVIGGPGNDTWTAGAGSDTFSGDDGTDTVEYRDRTAGVTITLDGRPDDGEAGELDNVGADVEEVSGGSGNDTIFAGANSVRLHGGGGNDTMKSSPQEDRVEGEEGDDTIDTRDGRYDSVDCGPGNDTLFADPGDDATGCEVAPDRDGDGTLNQFDCQPDNPAVHPGAGEIVGNDVDEDCLDGPGYLRVEAGVTFRFVVRKRPPRIRFATLRVSDLKSGDRVEVRCSGKGCAFKRKVIVARTKRLNLAPRFKRRFLRRGAVVEIRILRANFEAKVFRLRVTAGPDVRQTRLCMKPRETTPRICG